MSTALDEPAGKTVLPARGRIDEQLIHQFLDLGLGIDELAQVAAATNLSTVPFPWALRQPQQTHNSASFQRF